MHKSNDLISKLKTDAEKYWLSPAAVDLRLAEIAQALGCSEIGVEVSVKDVKHTWGVIGGAPIVTRDVDSASEIKMSLFQSGGEKQSANIEVQQTLHSLSEAMDEVWAKRYRNGHGGLNLKASGAVDVFIASIPNLVNQITNGVIALVYVDLDRFKQINDKCSHDEGDRALRSVYAAMHETARELRGLVFFDGGDEFILATPSNQAMEIASSLWTLRGKLQSLTFGEQKLTIDMTAGVAIRSVNELYSNYVELKGACEALTKQPGGSKEKKRGTITFESQDLQESSNTQSVNPKYFFQLGIALSRSRQFVRSPFGDERLNFIAKRVIDLCDSVAPGFEQLTNVVQESIDWLGMGIGGECSEYHLLTPGFGSGEVPKHAVALAVLHGLSKGLAQNKSGMVRAPAPALGVAWGNSNQAVAVTYDSQVVWGEYEKPKSSRSSFFEKLSRTVKSESENKNGDLSFGPLVEIGTQNKYEGAIIGVQIGFDEVPRTPGNNLLPLDFLIDYVRVDDRPRTGGGLPDFWQVALAQVIAAQENSGLTKVLVWGISPENTETFQRLTGKKKWPIDEVSLLAGLSTETVVNLEKSLPAQVSVVKGAEVLLQEIFDAYQSFAGRQNEERRDESKSQTVLRRAMAEADPLGQNEGIVCPTAALAYPVVIDTLRKSAFVRHSCDDANQDLRELIAYKIKLTNPLVSPIPAYLSSQKDELESYARKVLLDKNGFFRSKLENAGGGQIDGFVALLSSYVEPTNNKSTRRACLVVPNEYSKGGEYRPLGLISVWATPRNNDNGGKFIDFVFVWRTVEAFIGLPYSLYGSIELAKQLVNSVSTVGGAKAPQLGELTYIALSLHLGSDKFHMRVAKQIVDSASD